MIIVSLVSQIWLATKKILSTLQLEHEYEWKTVRGQ